MQTFKEAFQWIVYSSKDPQKIALTLKSIFAFVAILGVDATVLDGLQNSIVDLVSQIGLLISTAFAAYGFARKIYLTFFKKNV